MLTTLQVQLYISPLQTAISYMQPSIQCLKNLIFHTNIYYLIGLRKKVR